MAVTLDPSFRAQVEQHPPIATEYLPSSGSASLKLEPATPLEHQQTWLLNADEWKGPLDLAQYLERERLLLCQDLTRDGQLTAWILTDTSLPLNADGSRPMLAACETILKKAYIARAGKVQEVLAHGIGSVFARSEYRGKGYAARMMTELAKRLESWQQKNDIKGSFSVLYSDIGQKFYAKFGWNPFRSTHIHLDPVSPEVYEQLRTHIRTNLTKTLPLVEDLTTGDLNIIPAEAYVEAELAAFSEMEPKVPHVAVRPDLAHFAWHHAREEVQSQMLGLPFPRIKGAIHRASGIAMVWCRVYAHDQKEWSLHVLHVAVPPALRAGPKADDHLALSALLLRAQKEAHLGDMHAGVEVWDPSGFVISAAQKLRLEEDANVEVIQRDSHHICSLKWIGVAPEDDPTREVTWMHNEKYAWC